MVDDAMPDFEEMITALNNAKPLNVELTAYEAFVLVGFLQMGARQLGGEYESTGFARAIAVAVGQRLSDACPITTNVLAAGWHPEWDVDTSLDYWAAITPESALRKVFESEIAPIKYGFSVTSQAVGPHYIIDPGRLTPAESEALALYLIKLWDVNDSAEISQIKVDISKGLPARASHFTGEVVTSPKEVN